jgi:hypothetical protein
MSSRPDSRNHINQLNIASMVVLLVIVVFFFLKDSMPFETQKWIYLILGVVLIIVDALRIRAAIQLGNTRLLIVRIITMLLVIGFVAYWLYLHFL